MSEDAVYRSGRRESFTVLYNSMISDTRLGLEAKGLFAVMISRPEGWEFSVSGLAAYAGVSKDKIRRALQQLEEVGYLLRAQGHDEGGKFAGNVYVLQDFAPPKIDGKNAAILPLSEKPVNGKTRQREKPSSVFSTQSSKDLNITPPIVPPMGDVRKRKSKATAKWKPERFEGFWAFYRDHARGEDRAGAVEAWDRLQPDDALIDTMAAALKAQTQSETWRRGIGIPYACRWIRKRRWEDTIRPAGGAPALEALPERRFVGTKIIDGEEVDVYE